MTASGVELRVPFIDSRLFETVSRIPSATRLQPGKALLLAAVPEIPDWVARRPKRGFLLPMTEWLDGEWARDFAQPAAPPAIAMDTWYRRWAVLVFERWSQQLMVTNE